jgi:Tfp pilus assembly protein PilV
MKLDRLREIRGVSLIEIMVGVTILTFALLSLASAGGVAVQQLHLARADMHRWAALQEQIETLSRVGYDSVKTDSSVVQGYPMRWIVNGANPKKVVFLLERTNLSSQVVEDTLVLYFADPNP